MDKLVGFDITKKLVIPFDFRSVNWTTSVQQQGEHTGNSTAEQISPEDNVDKSGPTQQKNSKRVIQRLSAAEKEIPSQGRHFSEKDMTSMQSKRHPTPPARYQAQEVSESRNTTSFDAQSRETGQTAVNQTSITQKTTSQKQIHHVQRQASIVKSEMVSQAGAEKVKRPDHLHTAETKYEPRRSSIVLDRKPLRPMDVNQRWMKNSQAFESTTTRSTKWRDCLSTVQPSSERTGMHVGGEPVNQTLKFLKEWNQRQPVDWVSQARAIVEARSRQHCAPSQINPYVQDCTNEDLATVGVWSNGSPQLQHKRKASAILADPFSAEKTPPRTNMTEDQFETPSPVETSYASVKRIKTAGSMTGSRENDHTGSDTASVFSFL